MTYKKVVAALHDLIGEEIRITLVANDITLASVGAKLMPPPYLPKPPWSTARGPSTAGPTEMSFLVNEESFLDAEYLYEGGPLRIRFREGVDLVVARSADYRSVPGNEARD